MDIADKIYEEKAGRPERFRCIRCGKTAKRYMQIWWTSRGERLTCADCLRELHPPKFCEECGAPYLPGGVCPDCREKVRNNQRPLEDFSDD